MTRKDASQMNLQENLIGEMLGYKWNVVIKKINPSPEKCFTLNFKRRS